MTQDSAATKAPPFHFTHHPCLAAFAVDQKAYLAAFSNGKFDAIGTGALVFDTADATKPRILLVQRSASDSMPHKWEVPGGGCDDEDETILHAVARELWEEAGLQASHMIALAGHPHLFPTRSGRQVCKYNFVVQVDPNDDGRMEPILNPEEHQHFVWASEAEVRSKGSGSIVLDFTAKELHDAVLQAFDQLKEDHARNGQSV